MFTFIFFVFVHLFILLFSYVFCSNQVSLHLFFTAAFVELVVSILTSFFYSLHYFFSLSLSPYYECYIFQECVLPCRLHYTLHICCLLYDNLVDRQDCRLLVEISHGYLCCCVFYQFMIRSRFISICCLSFLLYFFPFFTRFVAQAASSWYLFETCRDFVITSSFLRFLCLFTCILFFYMYAIGLAVLLMQLRTDPLPHPVAMHTSLKLKRFRWLRGRSSTEYDSLRGMVRLLSRSRIHAAVRAFLRFTSSSSSSSSIPGLATLHNWVYTEQIPLDGNERSLPPLPPPVTSRKCKLFPADVPAGSVSM